MVVETITRIRREHRDGKPIKAIARDLRLSRNTVRKAVCSATNRMRIARQSG